ncbi:MAG: hypothetical protein M3O28_03720 [Actinomycetota bacterium]|nr:hypothetical protein [Actinomycetota bacterium]MDP9166037.1 hypothetical protein [Actinomycetota bacterium]
MVDKTATARKQSPNGRVHGRAAAAQVDEAQHLAIDLPILGTVRLPRPEHLAYYGAVGALVALELIDWPIALLVAVGHGLAQQQHSQAIQQLGEGLEDAG